MFSVSTNQAHDTTDPSFKVADTVFEDSIANICWDSRGFSNLLAVSSWDSKIRCYVARSDGALEGIAVYNTEFPCLSLGWMSGSNCVVTGSIDGTVASVDVAAGRSVTTIGKHDDAVKGVYHFSDVNAACSLSYDQTLKFWDLRQQQGAIATINLGAKPVCSDMTFPIMAVGLSSQKFLVFDVKNAIATQSVGPQMDTTLGPDSQLSSLSLSKEGAIGLGSYSGRSAIAWLKPSTDNSGSFTMSGTYCFKGHKIEAGQTGNLTNKAILFPINTVAMHPTNKDAYLTGGRDGFVHFWNITKKSRLGGFTWKGVPVTEAKWSPDGIYVAYGIGYDWSLGIEGAKSHKTKLCLHRVQPTDLPRP